jgi:hypothetical protein
VERESARHGKAAFRALMILDTSSGQTKRRSGSNSAASLWAGIDWKLEAAQISLHEMARSLSPERTTMTVVHQSTGAIISHRWEQTYEHVDTFLAKARSVPEIIESCFGADRVLMQRRPPIPKRR